MELSISTSTTFGTPLFRAQFSLAFLPAVALKASGHASEEWKRYLNMTPNQLQNLFKPLDGQDAEEVKAYGLNVLHQLRETLGYSEIANFIASLEVRS